MGVLGCVLYELNSYGCSAVEMCNVLSNVRQSSRVFASRKRSTFNTEHLNCTPDQFPNSLMYCEAGWSSH